MGNQSKPTLDTSPRLSGGTTELIADHILRSNQFADFENITEDEMYRVIDQHLVRSPIGITHFPRPPIEILVEAMRRVEAKNKLLARWQQMGGSASQLGLPQQREPKAEADSNRFFMKFRGGTLSLDRNNMTAFREEAGPPARLTFEGLILHSRQETGRDEIYGQAGYRLGSIIEGDKVRTFTFHIPEVSLGGRGQRNTRVWKTSQQIYHGPPTGMELFVGLAEHDSGDRSVLRNKVKEAIESGSRDVLGALGATGGLPTAGFLSESVSSTLLQSALTKIASWFVLDVFGMGDDPYNPGGLSIGWHEMERPPQLHVAGHSLDNKTIEYTHKIDMSGIDDAGAVGNISAYFRVWR